eukprot:3632965-Alexandrium_andersonii.AAC.1
MQQSICADRATPSLQSACAVQAPFPGQRPLLSESRFVPHAQSEHWGQQVDRAPEFKMRGRPGFALPLSASD